MNTTERDLPIHSGSFFLLCCLNPLILDIFQTKSSLLLLPMLWIATKEGFSAKKCMRNTFSFSPQHINNIIIIHQTHYEKSDWSRAFNQFKIAYEPDMINAISAWFNVCLVTKPLGVFSSETKWLNASLLFLRMNYVKNV